MFPRVNMSNESFESRAQRRGAQLVVLSLASLGRESRRSVLTAFCPRFARAENQAVKTDRPLRGLAAYRRDYKF